MPAPGRLGLNHALPAMFLALPALEILLKNGELHLAPDNLFLLAAVPTLLVSWRTGSFFGAVAAGMSSVALLHPVW